MNGWLPPHWIIVAVFFMPVYLKNKIFTMPQYLQTRYNGQVSMIMAVFWLLLYVLVNLTSILYLGALAISSISGFEYFFVHDVPGHLCCHDHAGWHEVIGYTDDTGFLPHTGRTCNNLPRLKPHWPKSLDLKVFWMDLDWWPPHAKDHFIWSLISRIPIIWICRACRYWSVVCWSSTWITGM